jgi:Uma2 family endonuclease
LHRCLVTTAVPLLTNAELCEQADALAPPSVGEVIAGVLYVMGRPPPAHASVEEGLIIDLKEGRRGGGPPPEGWYFKLEVEVRFESDEKVVPDVAGWLNHRIAGHRNDNPIRVVPDWVCEIVSDSTRRKDLGPKRDLYAQQAVKLLWLVDPQTRQLEAFALGPDGRWVLLGSWFDDAVVSCPPFEQTPLAMSRWWLVDS